MTHGYGGGQDVTGTGSETVHRHHHHHRRRRRRRRRQTLVEDRDFFHSPIGVARGKPGGLGDWDPMEEKKNFTTVLAL